MEDNNINNFENFNKRNFSYSTIRKFLNGIHKEEDIKIFMKDTIAVVVNGGKEFFVTKDIYNNDCDNLDLTISKKLEYMNEKIKIQNNDEKNNKMYKIIKIKDIFNEISYEMSYKRYKFIPTGPFENSYKNKIRNWVPYDIPDNLNIYTGSPIKYNKKFIYNEDIIKPFKNHIKEILADNIDKSYNFILNMLAHMVQKPNIKTEVCMVFISSSEGAGKNIFWDNFSNKIIGKKYSAHINDLDTLMSPFNSILSNKIITVLDEVKTKFGGKSSDRFKSMITTKMFNLNQKGLDIINMNDYNNYIILSNNDIPVNIGPNDRRFFVSNVSNKMVNNQKYFTDFSNLWEDNNAVEHFYHYLCNIDLSNFRPQREIPVTPRKIEIKQETIDTPIKFLIEIANNKYEQVINKKSNELYEVYQEYCYEEICKTPHRKLDFFKSINKFVDNIDINSERKKIYTITKNNIIQRIKELFKIDSLDELKTIEYTISSDEEPNNPDKLTSSESSSSSEEETYTSDTSQNSENSKNSENLENVIHEDVINNDDFDINSFTNKIEKVKGQINVYKVIINGKVKYGSFEKLKNLQNDEFLKILNEDSFI